MCEVISPPRITDDHNILWLGGAKEVSSCARFIITNFYASPSPVEAAERLFLSLYPVPTIHRDEFSELWHTAASPLRKALQLFPHIVYPRTVALIKLNAEICGGISDLVLNIMDISAVDMKGMIDRDVCLALHLRYVGTCGCQGNFHCW